jgi:phosphatidate cytidylyltransferase
MFRCTAAQLAVANTCPTSPLFVPAPLGSFLPAGLNELLPTFIKNLTFMPVEGHTVIIALFASIIAPFGGFFASAMKRAFQKKDFDQLIPGHGGVTDRMDCQFLIGLFIYVYYATFIKQSVADVDSILLAISSLPLGDQRSILGTLQSALGNLAAS